MSVSTFEIMSISLKSRKVGQQPIEAKEIAKANGEMYYFTGKSCRRGHIANRFTANSVCVECDKFHKLDKDNLKNYELIKKYGITIADYKKLFEDQNGVCAICKQSETKKVNGKVCMLAVDHCHDTKLIRALLCYNCNVGIGFFKHNPALLRKAALYCEEA